MKTKLILKGLLLYTTILAITVFISGIDSIYNNGYFTHSFTVCVALCYACYKLISKEEFEVLTLYKWIDNKLKNK